MNPSPHQDERASRPPGDRSARWGLRAVLLAGLVLLLAAAPALAQTQDDPDEEVDPFAEGEEAAPESLEDVPLDAPPVDTVGTPGFMWGFQPRYATDYRLTRQRKDWFQSLLFARKAGPWDLKGNADFTIGRDTGQGSDDRDGSARGTLMFRGIRKVPMTLDFRYVSFRGTRPGVDSEDTNTDGSLGAKYTGRFAGIRNTVDVKAGLGNTTKASLSSFGSSNTSDLGLSGIVDWKGLWVPMEAMEVNLGAHEERARKQSTVVGDTSRVEQATDRRQTNLSLDVTYEPLNWFTGEFHFADRSGNETLPIAQSGLGSLEERATENRTLNASFGFTPRENLQLTWTMGTDATVNDLSVQTQRSSRGDGQNWKGGVSTVLLGIDVTGEISWASTLTEPKTSIASERVNKIVGTKFRKKLSRKFEARWSVDSRLRQTFYRADPSQIQDSDELRTKIDTGLIYTPGGKWTANLSYVTETTDKLQVNLISASETNTEENRTVNIGFTYNWSAVTSISQVYYIQATLTRFLYSPGNNRENQSQRINTKIQTRPMPKVVLSMSHNFNLTDSGTFNERNGHVFNRANRTYRQDLTTRIDYTPLSWFAMHAQEQFLRGDVINTSTQDRSIVRNLELEYGLNLQKTLRGGVQISVDGAYVRNSARPSFLRLTSSLDKAF